MYIIIKLLSYYYYFIIIFFPHERRGLHDSILVLINSISSSSSSSSSSYIYIYIYIYINVNQISDHGLYLTSCRVSADLEEISILIQYTSEEGCY